MEQENKLTVNNNTLENDTIIEYVNTIIDSIIDAMPTHNDSVVPEIVQQENITSIDKLERLLCANKTLKLNNSKKKFLFFIYSAPKVGSTSLVSSLRIFLSNIADIIHIHDEAMLNILGHIYDVTVNEIIEYNRTLGRNIVVIDSYRCPIERKISMFFEKIGCYHFNNADENVNNYNIANVIKRFNNICVHLGNNDNFIDTYNIPLPEKFDTDAMHLEIDYNGIKYIKLRLCDSSHWGAILTKILGHKIVIMRDYEGSKKATKTLYAKFKQKYMIPINILETVLQCKYLNYYYSLTERANYRAKWLSKSTDPIEYFSFDQYTFYNEICAENAVNDSVQSDHYFDDGCVCRTCSSKRALVARTLVRGSGDVLRSIRHVQTVHVEPNKSRGFPVFGQLSAASLRTFGTRMF